MQISIKKRFRAPLDQVFAWCTDFQDNDPALSRTRLRTRTVLSRDRRRVEMDETGKMAFPFAAHYSVVLRPPDRWEADGRSNMGHTHNMYRLSPDGDDTRLEVSLDLHLTGPYRVMAPFARGFVTRRISREWDDFVRAMESGQ